MFVCRKKEFFFFDNTFYSCFFYPDRKKPILLEKKTRILVNKEFPEKSNTPVQTRGGELEFVLKLDNFVECFLESGVYELQDPTLKNMIKQVLRLPSDKFFDVLIIDLYVLTISYIASNNPIAQLLHGYINVLLHPSRTILKGAIGFGIRGLVNRGLSRERCYRYQ